MPSPYYFDEFFASGKEETISPFLSPSSRGWGKNLRMRLALGATFFLILAFITSFFVKDLSHLFLIVVYFFAGTPALIGALEDLKNLEINIDVLMVLAALLSVMIGSGMEGGLLLVLFDLSAAMEGTVAHKTKSALIHLNRLSPTKATVLDSDGHPHEKALTEISKGTPILIKPGEVVPLDGTVIAGETFVNLVHLTGESIPISKSLGDPIPAGARNLDGTLTISVTRTSADSTLSHIIHLITEAQGAKPQLQRFLDRFGKKYATTIICLSIFFALILPLFAMPFLGVEGSIYRALTFLIAASPCALIISTPTAYLSALSACTKKGILLKGGVLFDALTHCKNIAFDKTGTLTTGNLRLTRTDALLPELSITPDRALQLAAALEASAHHPIAAALTRAATDKGLPRLHLDTFLSVPGRGLTGTFEGMPLIIGNHTFIEKHLPDALSTAWPSCKESLTKEAGMFTLLLAGNDLFAFHFQDEIRAHIPAMITALKRENLKPIMLTGDRAINAHQTASEIGLNTFYAELTPEDKLDKVATLSKESGLIMVGEGINDAPALARSTVGIALGQVGSGAAIDAADIIFLRDEITLLPSLFRLAKKTLFTVRQNITLSIALIILSSLPALLGLIPLWAAVILHEGGTLLVGLNSLRLLNFKSLLPKTSS